jgi:outer membrane lipopolysaccharide assembly protein LptE/RlpB
LNSHPLRRAVLALLLVAPLAGCGYALVGSGRGVLPEGIRSIFVPTFVNETARVGLEQRVTEAVLRELAARARLAAASRSEEADAELVGRLVSYSVSAVRFDDAGRALEYEIAVTAKVTLTERVTDKVLFENPSFLFRQPYKVPPAAEYADVETAAIDALARPFARSLVTTILEGF